MADAKVLGKTQTAMMNVTKKIGKWVVESEEDYDISEIAGVAEATIRQSYKLMYPKAKSIFPEDFVFHTPITHLPTF